MITRPAKSQRQWASRRAGRLCLGGSLAREVPSVVLRAPAARSHACATALYTTRLVPGLRQLPALPGAIVGGAVALAAVGGLRTTFVLTAGGCFRHRLLLGTLGAGYI